MKTDGRTIFSIAGGRLEAVDVTGAAPRPLGGIDLNRMTPSGLILVGDRLLVLGDSGAPHLLDGSSTRRLAGAFVTPSWIPSTVLVQLDVSVPARPRVITRMRADGRLVSARRTGETVRVVLASSPVRLPLVGPRANGGAAARSATRINRRVLVRANASAWVPRLTIRQVVSRTTVRRAAAGCRAVSRPADFSGLGMVDVLTLDASDTLTLTDSDAILTDAEIVYASPTAMYVATTRWASPQARSAQSPPRGSTLIHKLDTSDPTRTRYLGSGTVRGYLLNQFSMSENEGVLRTASTDEPEWWSPSGSRPAPSESFVTTLAERDGSLATLGRVGGLGRGERIYAVRFLGTRGYVVTFRRTDPLYALDLADPAHPTLRGALEIPGFSSYLHPIDENTLIGVGQAADSGGRTQGTQVSLFDVSDPGSPRRIARRALDTAWSEAESDHHAFLYWAPTRTLVLPVQSYGDPLGPTFLGAVGLTVERETGITPIARVRHPDERSGGSPVRRSVVVGESVYTISDTGLMASALPTLEPRGWVMFSRQP